MPDYAKGKIYKIVGDSGATYYGSTACSLKDRMRKHLYDKGTTAYQKIISQMDYEMFLLENYPCESRKQLEIREAWYIREYPCVNRQIPGRTNKQWIEDNQEETTARFKKYYQDNKTRLQIEHKQRYEDNKIKRLAQVKTYARWKYSFGKEDNCLQKCDYRLFS